MNFMDRPKIGVATLVEREGLFLFGKRINSHGNNTFSTPGGHLEKYESFFDCARRELEEETGLKEGIDVKYLSKNPFAITNDFFLEENKHYVTLFLKAKQISNKIPEVLEPNKCLEWTYFSFDELIKRKDLFLPIQNLIKDFGYLIK